MINWSGFWGFFSTGVPFEILYPSLFVMMIAIVVGIVSKKVKNKGQFVIRASLVEYLFVLVCSTVICRDKIVFEFGRLQLKPFWTYMAVINHTPGIRVWDIVLNVVLFVPLGMLVKWLYPYIKLRGILLIGAFLSVCIETSQYLLCCGAAQIDDVMHNTIGAMIGWGIAWICIKGFKKFKSSKISNLEFGK